MRVKRNRKIVAGAAVVGLIAAGAAYAFWTAGGAGTGTAAAAADGAPLVIVQTSPITGLTPGGTAKPLSGNINNPNQFAVPVAGITAVVSGVVPATCTVDNFAVTGYGDATPVAGIPSGNAQGAWSGLAIQLVNKVGVNQDVCKGAAITVAYTITNAPPAPAAPASLVGGVLTVNYVHTAYVGNATALNMYLKDSVTNGAVSNYLQTSTGTTAAFNFTGSTFTASLGSPVTPFPAIVVGHVYNVIIAHPAGIVLATLPVTAS